MSKTVSKAEPRTVICKNCGKALTAAGGKKIFCSKKCCNAAHVREYREKKPCKFQEGVACTDQKCENCGWNPEIAEQRRKEAVERICGGV